MSKIREEARKYASKYSDNEYSYFGFLNGAISDEAREFHQDEIFNFAQWHSGMGRDKILKAYERYLKEKSEQIIKGAN